MLRSSSLAYGRDGKIPRTTNGCTPVRPSQTSRMSLCERSIPADQMKAWPIDARVNSPKNNDPGILRRQSHKLCQIWSHRQRFGLRKRNRTSSKKVWSNRVASILFILVRRMRKIENAPNISPIKPEIRTWYAFEGPLGDVIHNKRFFFAWKEGCLMGTYNTLEEATASLTSRETREIH
jgi:hypothetical protein